uniref:Uncharacterized protein n=1 Tax=Candidatus Methanophaga sp. ANME-1 ERB7 TaxID=2759913 RepID=A0A7G9Z2P3_9EURY|nr:hypothetical protein LPKEAICH_00018 [Methanosarcinales archaeon ANME-1 ERB7]
MRTVWNSTHCNLCSKPRHFNAFVTCVDATYSYLSGGLIIKPMPSRSRRAITRGGAVWTGNCGWPIFQSEVAGLLLFANSWEKLRSNR